MGEPIWLKNYPDIVPAEIGPLPAPSVGEFMQDCCTRYADRDAFTLMGSHFSYRRIGEDAEHFAAYLQSLGLENGARVALMMPNTPQYPIALIGALRAGMTVVNVNPQYTARELRHQLVDAGAEAIVVLENFASVVETVIAQTSLRHVVVTSFGDMLGLKGHLINFALRHVRRMVPSYELAGHVGFKEALKRGGERSFRPVEVGPEEIAFLQYTGGTTGIAKGAMLSHRNVLSNVAQIDAWLQVAFRDGFPKDMAFVCALPLYHIFALTVNLMIGMKLGATNILIPNPRDIGAFVKELKRRPFHVLPGLNTLFVALMDNEDFRGLDFGPLRLTLGGGMAVQGPVAKRWKALTGKPIHEGYGLSETSPVATANRFDAPDHSGTIGLPLPSTQIAICDDDGAELTLGMVGEICIRGPQVMAGYWNRPDETARVMTAEGYFRSGDVGFMSDDGSVKIVDRKKDMILVSGFNVYPNEIEDVVVGMEGIVEAAVIAIADEHSGEVPKLFVVRSDPTITEQTIKDYCRANLTGYKRPRAIEFRDSLPKSNVGKILRKDLRQQPAAREG